MTVMESILATAESETVQKTAAMRKVADLVEARKLSGALTKYAGLPYQPQAYDAMCEIMKIAGAAVAGLVEAVETETARADGLKKVAEVGSMLNEMLDQGLVSKSELQEKAAALLKKTDRELEIVKEAMALTKTANMSNLFETSPGSGSTNAPSKRGMFDTAMN